MQVQQIRIQSYCLPLRRRWRSAAGSFDTRRGFLVIVKDDRGLEGYGDCAPLAGTENIVQACDWLNEQAAALAGRQTEAAFHELPIVGRCPPAARCGLETALLDLMSRQQRLPLYRWLEPKAAATVNTSVNLGSLNADTPTHPEVPAGSSVVKLKVGLLPVPQDIHLLQRFATTLSDGIRLRLDANQAWTRQQARDFIEGIANLPVDCLEEPLQATCLDELKRLQESAPFPLALDESLTRWPHAEVLSMKPVAWLVLKPMLLGGLGAALELARRAHRAGLGSLVTTTVDSAVGSWAAAHLAAAVNVSNHESMYHGLATSAWLSQDIAIPPTIRDGSLVLSENAGLGFQPTQ